MLSSNGKRIHLSVLFLKHRQFFLQLRVFCTKPIVIADVAGTCSGSYQSRQWGCSKYAWRRFYSKCSLHALFWRPPSIIQIWDRRHVLIHRLVQAPKLINNRVWIFSSRHASYFFVVAEISTCAWDSTAYFFLCRRFFSDVSWIEKRCVFDCIFFGQAILVLSECLLNRVRAKKVCEIVEVRY